MSHFTVAVITAEKPTLKKLEEVLQPYHEYECTGVKDQYVVRVEGNREEVLEEYAKEYGDIDTFARRYFGYDKDEKGYYYFTNPNKKWDWWVVGGRWPGLLTLKEGTEDYLVGEPGLMTSPAKPGFADAAACHNIDWDSMEDFGTFAVLTENGQWHERGRMGWWACVSDEKEAEVWDKEFADLLPPQDSPKWITIVDCHI